jgi:hypothetical protein
MEEHWKESPEDIGMLHGEKSAGHKYGKQYLHQKRLDARLDRHIWEHIDNL